MFLKGDTPSIAQEHLYGLAPLDPRLHWGSLTNPGPADIRTQLKRANALGYEGLVLRQGDQWIKIKPAETHDVSIAEYVEGRGKHRGRLGFVRTIRGPWAPVSRILSAKSCGPNRRPEYWSAKSSK